MEQFEQLLTCAICLDRYRNPKLLPCQHSFCMEPCMDGLVDYVRRQVKCPECRAEHRIPYQGVQGYPTNVTLQRFLELHIEITGELPDPTSGQIMERCNVCSEKAYCTFCSHCDKKICPECKGAHMDILRREISRINSQIRRAVHRLQDMLSIVEKNMLNLQTNCSSVSEEVDEIHRRLSKALKDRTEFLRGELDRYTTTEIRNLSTLKENLDVEISNIQSNCDIADKHINEDVDWDDCELMDAKEIFLKTVEFIRNFEYETTDYNRRVRFAMAHDPNQLVLHVAGYGELNISMPSQLSPNTPQVMGSSSSANLLQPPGPGLMRSKSDHRLTTQFRQQEDKGYGYGGGEEESSAPRKFGDRYNRPSQYGESRYGRQEHSEFESPYDNEPRSTRSGYRSRFRRDRDNDSDNDTNQTRAVRFSEPAPKEREKVLDTEDATKGPISGITRLADSPRVMKRIADIGKPKPQPKQPEPKPVETPKFQPKKTQRQVSEEDEISRIKKQNKSEPSTAAVPETPERPPDTRKTPPAPEAQSTEEESEEEEDEDETPATPKPKAPTPSSTSASASRRSSDDQQGTDHKKAGRSASSDSSTSTESSSSAVKNTGAAYTTEEVKQKFVAKGSDSGSSTPRGRLSSTGSDTAKKDTPTTTTKPPFQSRFLNRSLTVEKPKEEEEEEEESDSSSESASESEEESDAGKKKPAVKEMDKTDIGPLLARSANARDTATRRDSRDDGSTYRSRFGSTADSNANTSGSTTRRYGQAAEEPAKSRYGVKEEETPRRYGQDKSDESTGSRYLNRNRTTAPVEEEQPKYGGYTSRFLNKSKSSAAVSPDEDSDKSSRKYLGSIDDDSKYPSGRSRYTALKDRKNRIARSRSSHNFGNQEDEEEEDLNTPNAYMQSKYGATTGSDLARSRSSHHLKSRENSPDRPGPGTDKDGAALSSWARYLKQCIGKFLRKLPGLKEKDDKKQDRVEDKELSVEIKDEPSHNKEKEETASEEWGNSPGEAPPVPIRKNKYGNRGKDGKDNASNSTLSSVGAGSSSATSRRLSLGLPLRHNSASFESSDDDQKNTAGSPTSPTVTAAAGFAAGGSTVRNQYLQKRRQLFKVGSRGSEPGCFTWPRGIAVSSDNSIVVADSSNHRVQVFDSNGIFVKEFGTYGNAEGEFDCLAGVAVNRIGQFIIADRYNHRIQVMDPAGRFLRSFGSQGTGDGKFNYPWGITTDALGFIYVCDKENHRVQVFQSDGTFVGKFGSHGNKSGQLEHPHYIAVSNTNRVIVSDSNNHRVQIFDVNGRVLSSFGSEGSEDGQFKFPRDHKQERPDDDTSIMSQKEEYFSCHSNDSNKSFEKALNKLKRLSAEERVMKFLQTSTSHEKLSADKIINNSKKPRRSFSDVTPEVLRRAQSVLKHIALKSKLTRQNSMLETIPLSSPIYPVVYPVVKVKEQKVVTKAKPGLRKYHPLNVVLNSGPDLSHILKPETLAILNESRLQSFNYATDSLVDSLRHDAHAATDEGSGSGRSGVHLRRGLGQQPHSNLPPGWSVPTSVRVLGVGRRGVQGTGGSRSYEQWQHSGVRPRESPHSSVLSYTNRSHIAPSRSFEAPPFSPLQSPSTYTPRSRTSSSSSRSYLQRPRSTIF